MGGPFGSARGPTRRAFLAGAGLGLAAACASPRARSAPRAVPVVYDEHGGLFIDARVAGRPARLILDTGASRSSVSAAFAREAGLALGAGGAVEGSAGTVQAAEAVAEVEVPGFPAERLELLVYEFASYDPLCVGILGHEILRRAPFQVRYGERVVVFDAEPPARAIPLSLDGGIPRIRARVNGAELDLRIDTGAALAPGPDAYVNLTRGQADDLGLTGEPERVFTATGTGGAVLELPVYALASLEVAGRDLARAFAIVQPLTGYFARADAVGFLGNAVLDKLDPYLDYAGGRFGAGA